MANQKTPFIPDLKDTTETVMGLVIDYWSPIAFAGKADETSKEKFLQMVCNFTIAGVQVISGQHAADVSAAVQGIVDQVKVTERLNKLLEEK